MPPREKELEALKGLEKCFEGYDENRERDPARYSLQTFLDATSLAAELAAKNGRLEQAGQLALRCAEADLEWTGSSYILGSLASNRHVAPLLLKGLLAETLGLDNASCRSALKDLKAAVEARMKKGRTLVYGKWTWERLLRSASRKAIMAHPDPFTKEQRKSKWLGRPPATEDGIAAVEERLKLKLPHDYCDFLRVSNGFSALSPSAPPLLGVEKIDYLKNAVEKALLDVLRDWYPADGMPEATETCILASDLAGGGTDMVLLIPPKADSDSWQTWLFADWIPGEIRYPSFRHYLEQTIQDLQQVV